MREIIGPFFSILMAYPAAEALNFSVVSPLFSTTSYKKHQLAKLLNVIVIIIVVDLKSNANTVWLLSHQMCMHLL